MKTEANHVQNFIKCCDSARNRIKGSCGIGADFQKVAAADRIIELEDYIRQILNIEEEGHRFSSDDSLSDVFVICRLASIPD